MKIRKSFVSNSSSTSFIIENLSDNDLTLVDFVKENPQLVEEFNNIYDYKYTQEEMIACAKERVNEESDNAKFSAKISNKYVFGDDDGDVVGHVFDYILRDGGTSKNFKWKFNEYYR